MSDVKTGLWQNVRDGKYIKVRVVNHKITSMVDCSDEGCADVYSLSVHDLLRDYELRESDAKRDRLVQVKQSSGIPKTLARHGSLDEYVDSLPAYEQKEITIESKWLALKDLGLVEVTAINVFDDGLGANLDDICFTKGGKAGVMNREKFLSAHTSRISVDDTLAQTFSDIQWDMGRQDKSKTILVTVCPKCGSTVPADSVEKPALRSWAARFLKAVKGIEVSE